MERRVVVTGIGTLSCVGKDKDTFWDSMVNGKSGIDLVTAFDTEKFTVKIGGEVKNFNPEEYDISKKDVRRLDRYLQFAIAGAKMAHDDAGLELSPEMQLRTGVCVGSGIGGMWTLENQHTVLLEQGPSRVSPFFIPMMIANMAAGHVSLRYGLKGPNFGIISACATGNHCIGEAFHIIKRGDADMMFAGGTESAISPIAFAGFANMHATSPRNDEPQKACRPFDAQRNGFVMAEGCGIFIMEELEQAKARGARIYAEVVGYGLSADAHHITNPEPGGQGAARAMKMALSHAGISPDAIDYINAHGTSTPAGDIGETLAIKSVFGERAYDIPISSSKSIMGHALGAAGALEAAATVMALQTGIIPPTINYEYPDPECDLNYVPNVAIEKDIKYAMSDSFGFGGQNAVTIFKKYE